jgi:glycosyltransferase involved in cell wall biosynthesis
MRVLVVTNLYPPYYRGGYELRCAQVAEALEQAGHEVWVLTSRYGLPSGKLRRSRGASEEQRGVRIHRWLTEYHLGPHPTFRWPWTVWRARSELADARRFSELAKSFRPDIVSWWSMYGLAKALLPLPRVWGIPDVHWIEHWWMIAECGANAENQNSFWSSVWDGEWGPAVLRPPLRLLGRVWERRVRSQGFPTREFLNRPEHVCFVSEHMRQLHREAGFEFESSEVIHGGVPSAAFYRPLERRAARDGPLRLLYAGQLSPDRGLRTIVEALGLLEDSARRSLTLTVAGAGSSAFEAEVRRLISDLELQDRVAFVGKVPHEGMADIYREHDVLVFPSMRDEGLPLTMVEAMLAGCAVITTGSGGAEEIALAANLPRFTRGNASELSKLLISFLASRDEVLRVASRGQRVALDAFSFERMMERWTTTLAGMAKTTRRPRDQT